MKRLIISAVLLLIMVTPMTALADNVSVVTQGDTTLVINGSDTLTLTGLEGITRFLPAVLNDTLVNFSSADAAANKISVEIEQASIWSRTARSIVDTIAVATVFVVFFCLLFYFLHRRRKYRMVEKAIANNYPLPPYVFGNSSPTYVPVPPAAPVENVMPDNEMPAGDEVPVGDPIVGQATPPPFNPVTAPARVNWRAFRGSFTLVAVGIGLMIFFHETALTGLCSIIVLLGIGRGFIEYQDQRDAIDAWRKR